MNKALLAQHLQSPSMWAIFQLQDLFGMDGALRAKTRTRNVSAHLPYWHTLRLGTFL
ncbi:MAG: hypothetical protein JNJ90_17625 [Saprospiraceae bacterium]|nr:hypothetical protein [Saprospiraceae bacterium]